MVVHSYNLKLKEGWILFLNKPGLQKKYKDILIYLMWYGHVSRKKESREERSNEKKKKRKEGEGREEGGVKGGGGTEGEERDG